MIPIQWVKNIFIAFWLAAYAVGTCFILQDMEQADMTNAGMSTKVYILLPFLTLPFIFSYWNTIKQYRMPSSHKWFFLYFCCVTIATLLHINGSIVSYIYSLSCAVLPFLFLMAGYSITRRNGNKKWFVWLYFGCMILVALQYFRLYSFVNFFGESHLVVSYFMLFFLPIVLTHPSKWIRIAAIVLTLVVLVSSVKRAGIMAFAMAMVIYWFIVNKEKHYPRWIKWAAIIGGLIVISGILWYVFTQVDDRILERIMNLSEDGGSGRLDVWETTMGMITHQHPIGWIIGNGFNSVGSNSPLDLAAHNDILEIIYDFGIVGLILYGVAVMKVCLFGRKMYQQNSPYAGAFICMLFIFAFLSMVSIVVIFFWLTYVMFTIGYFMGLEEYRLESIQQNNDSYQ